MTEMNSKIIYLNIFALHLFAASSAFNSLNWVQLYRSAKKQTNMNAEEWPLYICQQLLPGPFSTICTKQWKWTPSPKAALPIKAHILPPPPTLSPSAAPWSLGTKPIIAPLNADAVTGKCCLWRKCPTMTTFTAGWLLSLIHHSHILRWFAYFLPAAYQQQPFSLRLLCSSFYLFLSPAFFSLCPALANPNSQMCFTPEI